MNHIQKTFSPCLAVRTPYSLFCLCFILPLCLALSHDFVCMKVGAAIGPAFIPWMINDLGITGCVTATGENRIAVQKTRIPSATSHHTSGTYCSGKEPTPYEMRIRQLAGRYHILLIQVIVNFVLV